MASSRHIESVLRKLGFEVDERRGKGSHKIAFYRLEGKIVIRVVLPDSNDIPKGTLASIRRSLKLESDEFTQFLSSDLSIIEFKSILSKRL